MLGHQRLDQRAVSRSRVLELVDHQEGEALGERPAHVGAFAEQALQLDHQVAGVEAAAIAQHAIVTRVQVRELALALGSLALGRTLRLALALLGPVAQPAGGDPLRLQGVDAAQEPGQEPGRVAADLVPAQRQVVEPVEQHRQPIGGAHRGEEGVEPRLERVLSEQALGDDLIGRDPELLVGKLDQGGRARPQAGGGGARARQHHDPLGSGPRRDQPGEPGRERLAAPRAGRADHQHRPRAMLDHPPLGVRELHPEAGGVSLHRPNASGPAQASPDRAAPDRRDGHL